MEDQYLLGKYKLGKEPHAEDTRDLMLATYIDSTVLPARPDEFSWATDFKPDGWGMLLNNQLGDCVPAGVIHTQMVLAAIGNHHPEFDDTCAEQAYEEWAGYVPGDSSTDQGTDMRVAAKRWQKKGIIDSADRFHRCGAYVWLEPGNLDQLWYASYLFGSAVLGYNLTRNAMEAFDQQHYIWDFEHGSPSLGGHCVPGFGRISLAGVEGVFDSVSWGHQVGVTGPYIENTMDSGLTVLSGSTIDKTTEANKLGFDMEHLRHDLEALEVAFA